MKIWLFFFHLSPNLRESVRFDVEWIEPLSLYSQLTVNCDKKCRKNFLIKDHRGIFFLVVHPHKKHLVTANEKLRDQIDHFVMLCWLSYEMFAYLFHIALSRSENLMSSNLGKWLESAQYKNVLNCMFIEAEIAPFYVFASIKASNLCDK